MKADYLARDGCFDFYAYAWELFNAGSSMLAPCKYDFMLHGKTSLTVWPKADAVTTGYCVQIDILRCRAMTLDPRDLQLDRRLVPRMLVPPYTPEVTTAIVDWYATRILRGT